MFTQKFRPFIRSASLIRHFNSIEQFAKFSFSYSNVSTRYKQEHQKKSTVYMSLACKSLTSLLMRAILCFFCLVGFFIPVQSSTVESESN